MSHEPLHWRSLEELERTESYEDRMQREFGEYVEQPELDGNTRRHFLSVMGATMAMTGLSGCVRRPVDHIVPYARQPEEVLPGVASHYATATHIGGRAIGLLAESHEGRPTKLEGNPEFPASPGGGLTASQQAMLLELYDPQRMLTPYTGKPQAPSSWEAASAAISKHFTELLADPARKVAILSEANPSPTAAHLRSRFLKTFQGSSWFTYEPVSNDNERLALGTFFGRPVRPVYQINKADLVLSLDSDFLGTEGDSVSNSWQWAQGRKIEKAGDKISRFYAVEGTYTVTGTNADHRLRLAPAQVEAFAFHLLGLVGGKAAPPPALKAAIAERSAGLPEEAKKWAAAVADDFFGEGKPLPGVVIPGRRATPLTHIVATILNRALRGRTGTVYYCRDITRPEDDLGDMAGLKKLAADLNAGGIDTLVVLGGNPVYGAPGDIDLAAAIGKAKTVVALTDHLNETSKLATWALPRAHFLETWGDIGFTNGVAAIQQPLIEPLHGAWSEIELLARALGDADTNGHTIVRGFWKAKFSKSRNFVAAGFHKAWRKWLHDGRTSMSVSGPISAVESANPKPVGKLLEAAKPKAPTATDLELVFTPDPMLYDGRFSNNSWLQEAPDPITKITWDNVAAMSYATAKRLDALQNEGEKDAVLVNVTAGGKTVKMPAWCIPGMADDVIEVHLGYGRKFGNYLPYHLDNAVGFDVSPLRTSASPNSVSAKVAVAGGTYDIASVQVYGQQAATTDSTGFGPREGSWGVRPMVRETTLEKFNKDPKFAQPGIIRHGEKFPQGKLVAHPPARSTYNDWDYSKKGDPKKRQWPISRAEYQWGMAIDLNSCTGCNACLVACVAENNIMSVGKDQVRRGREMHWIRLDRYFVGDLDNPQVVHLPVNCQQCETAPCENVCPVTATSHSPEGLNDMAYNRCIGTRYCLNNCPFKVRRFNYYNFSKGQTELYHMARNPNVTVRFRGVVEKCTYCVQRINLGKRNANLAPNKRAARAAIDAIQTACQQTCPTNAITFGDLWDDNSGVSKAKRQDRDYGLLTELNLVPRTTFLAKIRNPNPKMGG